MGLRDRYAAPAAAAPAATPPPPQAAPAGPPSPEKRDMSAIRAKLAAGGGGGVNPPEMAEALKPEAFEPKTVEGPDGEPQPIESAAAPTPAVAAPAAGAAAKRTRRTKAQIEADNAAAGNAPSSEPSAPATDVTTPWGSFLSRLEELQAALPPGVELRIRRVEAPF